MENLQEHKLKKIRELKQEEYGDFEKNLNLIGQSWSSLLGLRDPIPGWLVSLMYVAAKMIRTRKKFKADNYDDAANYLLQARIMQQPKTEKWIDGYKRWKKKKAESKE
jgi:hypothetical protein